MVDENTRLVARLHPDLNNRGLNIYNPYFRAADVNADYHLFPTTSIAHSFQAMKTLGIAGAITAGPFETDPTLAALTDSLSPLSRRLGKIAMVANVNGELVGHHQAAYGLLDALTGLCGPPNDLDITIVGAGTASAMARVPASNFSNSKTPFPEAPKSITGLKLEQSRSPGNSHSLKASGPLPH